MPFGTGHDIKLGVIYEWLKGSSRDKIAGIYNISTGGVTNIINEWRNNIGAYIAEDLRDLSISLKKANITPIQCSIGFRVAKIMQRLGITEEQFESFMSDIYDRCQKLDLGPDQMERYLRETINISKFVFPSQIPNYINTKTKEIEDLQIQKKNKQNIISNLNEEISKIEAHQKFLIENNNVSVDTIKWYKDIKEELTNMGLSFDDIRVFLECVRGIKKYGYDVNKVVTRFAGLEYFDYKIDKQEEIIQKKFKEIEQLNTNKKNLEEQLNFTSLKISKNQELENMGFGLKELKIIYNTITEIAKENKINHREAIKKFFDDLNEYDDLLSFQKKVEELRKEVSHLSLQIANNRITLSSQQYIGTILPELLRIGISEKDILDINSILLLGGFEYYENDNKNIIINKQSLISQLTKYGNLKSVIKSLEQIQIQLTNDIIELGNHKLVLENYLNHLFLLFSNLKEIQLLLKKVNIVLEYPKILVVCLDIDSNKEDNKREFKDNNTSTKP